MGYNVFVLHLGGRGFICVSEPIHAAEDIRHFPFYVFCSSVDVNISAGEIFCFELDKTSSLLLIYYIADISKELNRFKNV